MYTKPKKEKKTSHLKQKVICGRSLKQIEVSINVREFGLEL